MLIMVHLVGFTPLRFNEMTSRLRILPIRRKSNPTNCSGYQHLTIKNLVMVAPSAPAFHDVRDRIRDAKKKELRREAKLLRRQSDSTQLQEPSKSDRLDGTATAPRSSEAPADPFHEIH
jgi:hypothetical protein